MPGKINVYNLGSKGVNVVKSPVHLDDGELTKAQNVQMDAVGSLGGIRKRDGMARLNSSVMTGSGKGIISLPLPDRSSYVRRFFVPYDYGGGAIGSNTFWESTDGTTWTAGTRGVVPQQLADYGASLGNGLGGGIWRWCVHRNRFYYPANSDGALHVYDGDEDTDYRLFKVPDNPRDGTPITKILSIVPYSSAYLLISTRDSTSRGRVFLFDVANGTLEQLGPETDLPYLPINPLVFQGRVFVGMYHGAGGSGAEVYYCRPGDASWTLDETLSSARGYIYNMVPFLGELYAGVGVDVGSNGVVMKRDKDTAWAAAATSDGTGAGNHYGPMAVSQDGLTIYGFRNSVSGGAAPTNRIMKSTDGASWSQDYDAGSGSGTSNCGIPWVDTNGDMYWVMFSASGANNGRIVKQSGGSYTVVKNDSANFAGPIVALSMPA